MVERKAFLVNPKHQHYVFQCGEHDCSGHNKKMEIIMSIEVCPIPQMNINYKQNGGNKSFSYKSKASISRIAMWRT